MEKDAETAAAKKAATSENPASLRRLQAAQKQAAAPYVVLSGSVRLQRTPLHWSATHDAGCVLSGFGSCHSLGGGLLHRFWPDARVGAAD